MKYPVQPSASTSPVNRRQQPAFYRRRLHPFSALVNDEDVPCHGDQEICLAESESGDVPLTGVERATSSRANGVVKGAEENDYEQVNAWEIFERATCGPVIDEQEICGQETFELEIS